MPGFADCGNENVGSEFKFGHDALRKAKSEKVEELKYS